MSPRILLIVSLTLAISTLSPALHAQGWSNVAINGQHLTQSQLSALESQVGTRIAPGAYLVDTRGCWMNLSNGTSGCLGGSVDTHSRYGSGERTADGSWNHYSRAADMGVGGTSDGCIYTTTGWSNC